ncbi:MAG: hypothetical protein QXL16_01140 [Candidatus Micrarchaeaceae archaeon]
MVILIILFIVSEFGPFKLVMVAFSIIGLAMLLLLTYADFVIFPLITNALKLETVPAKDYIIPPSQDKVIKKYNSIYYATGYLSANVFSYVFASEQLDESEDIKLAEAPDKWERAVMSIDFPFKYTIISFAHDVQKYRDELEGKRGYYEFQLARESQGGNPNPEIVQDLQRKINIVQARLERLSRDEKALYSIMYIETTATGISEKEASDNLDAQLSKLRTAFSGFDIDATRIVGRELYYVFLFNYILPSQDELTKLFFTQG